MWMSHAYNTIVQIFKCIIRIRENNNYNNNDLKIGTK